MSTGSPDVGDRPGSRGPWVRIAAAVALVLTLATAFFVATPVLDTTGFTPRWRCGTWSAWLGWTHVLADVATAGAYAAIPLVLLWFVQRRPDVPFPTVFWLFAAFILACGTGHLVDAVIFWEPVYRLAGAIKVGTALASWATVAALVPVVPHALAMPGLQTVNAELAREIESRRRIEAELRRRNAELEAFQHVAVDRELRMIDLKRQVNELHARLQLAPPYDLGFASRQGGSATGAS